MPVDLTNTGTVLRLVDLSVADVLLGMVLAFGLCAILARITVAVTPPDSSSRATPRTMVLLGVTVSLIMAVIGNSLARAFGAIGALSLIRFRTAVKDSRDLASLFMAIGIGMTAGSGHFKVAIGATGLMSIFAVLLAKLPLIDAGTRFGMMRIHHPTSIDALGTLVPVVRQRALNVQILGQEPASTAGWTELLLEVQVADGQVLGELAVELSRISPEAKVSVLVS